MSDSKPSKKETEIDILKNIETKIDKLTGVIAIQGKEENVQIEILKKLGLNSEEIGALLGMTATSIRMRMSRKKSSKSKKRTENND